ncbi:hypothetical protein [Paraclostridium sordellii]|uniref:hypothetical protein n=1 Tax=Paraclostridium sordellii TaxID=1505 RepID=UPI0005DC1071|nr:hypothetical protein [Paeniclostridium sordellii]CEN23996.1 putative DNA-binding protein [[Clostridium] sordellii] [Paeniclostridium sordellii]
MNKEEFNKLNFLDKIDYINNRLKEGQTVIRIREDIGIGEKALQKEIKANGYKYNGKEKQYVPTTETTTKSTTEEIPTIVVDSNTVVGNKNTIVVPKQQQQILGYLENNFEILQEFIEKYKATTKPATETTTNYISINLIDDKHLNPKPKSIRINEFVYQDWQKFCENKHYSKQDLISMALKEYMEKYK